MRLVGVNEISWSYFLPRNAAPSPIAACQDRNTLRNVDGGPEDEVFDMRDAYGADLVVGLVPFDPQSGGCTVAQVNPSPATEVEAFVAVAIGAEVQSTRHEIGHQFGLDHDVGNDCGSTFDNWACGYNFQEPQACRCLSGEAACGQCNPALNPPGCIDIQPYTDIMSKVNLAWRQNFYSDACVEVASLDNGTTSTCDDSVGASYGGTRVTNGQGEIAEGRRKVNDEISTLAAYRAEAPEFIGAELISPPPGWHISSNNVTFVWDAPPGALLYELETALPGLAWTSHGWTLNTYDTATVDASAPVIKVRISTFVELFGASGSYYEWVQREYRLNTADTMTACSDEESSLIPDPSFATADCTNLSGWMVEPACSEASGTFTCDLDFGGLNGATATVVSRFAGPERLYDIAAWGTTSNGQDFCCLYHDDASRVDEVRLEGTPNGDTLSFRFGVFTLQPYNGALEGFMTGLAGNDLLLGSDAPASPYSERLFGRQGMDTLRGGRGPELLEGGMGVDIVLGECGDDTLIGGPTSDNTSDRLEGGLGDDFVCSGEDDDIMLPSPQSGLSWEDDFMYYSSSVVTARPATVAYNPSVCGHPAANGGNPWGSCDSYVFLAPPGACAGKVPQ